MENGSRRRLGPVQFLLAFAVLAAVTASGCESEDYSPIATMRAMPESHLAPYPGAALLDEGSGPRRSSILEGTTGAYVFCEYGTNASIREVSDYYGAQLGRLGWAEYLGVWLRDGWEIRIEETSRFDPPAADQGYSLVYDVFLEQNWSLTVPSNFVGQ